MSTFKNLKILKIGFFEKREKWGWG